MNELKKKCLEGCAHNEVIILQKYSQNCAQQKYSLKLFVEIVPNTFKFCDGNSI